ncbi:MAG: TolC family protein [Holosporaceae bacterium]|nr:TolC family protein [Holosporaceae bacterium]
MKKYVLSLATLIVFYAQAEISEKSSDDNANVAAAEKSNNAEKSKDARDEASQNSDESEASSFEEAAVAAYNGNNKWKAQQTEKKIAEEELTQSKMLFLPSVNGKISSSRSGGESVEDKQEPQYDNNGSFKGYGRRLYRGGSPKSTTTRMDLEIDQNLFNGFSTVNTVKAKDFANKAAHHKLKSEEQELLNSIVETCANVWAKRRIVFATKAEEENLKKYVDALDSMLEAGVSTQADVAAANASYQNAVHDRVQAESELLASEAEFETLTGLKAGENMQLPNINASLPESLDKLVALAMSVNHQLRHSKLKARSADHELAAAKGKLSPKLDFKVSVGKDLSKSAYNDSYPEENRSFNSAKNNYVATLEATIPIFENSPYQGNSYSSIAIANQRALQAKFASEDSLRQIKKECIVNWNKYVSAKSKIVASLSAVKSGEIKSLNNLEEIEIGTKSITDIVNDEERLKDARINYAKAMAEKITSAAKILELCGKLDLRSLLSKNS